MHVNIPEQASPIQKFLTKKLPGETVLTSYTGRPSNVTTAKDWDKFYIRVYETQNYYIVDLRDLSFNIPLLYTLMAGTITSLITVAVPQLQDAIQTIGGFSDNFIIYFVAGLVVSTLLMYVGTIATSREWLNIKYYEKAWCNFTKDDHFITLNIISPRKYDDEKKFSGSLQDIRSYIYIQRLENNQTNLQYLVKLA